MDSVMIVFGPGAARPVRAAALAVSADDRQSVFASIRSTNPDNSARSQRASILEALQRLGAVTTIECTRYLDVIHPPRRVMELRERGYDITTTWVRNPTECGRLHRVGLYVLAKGV